MEATKHNCDILLNNFQIKKKRYRVLFNYDHLVWELWDAKQKSNKNDEKVDAKKETDLEREQLSNAAQYGSNSNLVHINEIIRIRKGDTKAASLRIEAPPTEWYNLSGSTVDDTRQQPNSQTPTAQYLSIHYAERIIKSAADCNRWRVCVLTLFNADPYIIAAWHTLLTTKLYANPLRLHVRRLLVFINPYGGRKEGLQTYERYCKPIFHLAGIDASCVISQRANQIRDILMSHDLMPYDAVCCVGGDGTAAEVINGLIFRAMRDRDLDMRQPAYIPKPALPIGIIPAGSTDTVAYSAHGTADARTAAIHVILGQRRGCDICSIRNRQGLVRFCASVFSYGYLGDVAARSEKYRWMGPKRYEYTGVRAFLANRGYEAEIRILESPENETEREAHTSRSTLAIESVCYANCQRCNSVVSKREGEGDTDGVANLDKADDVEHNDDALQSTTSNWTLNTEKSLEQDYSVADDVREDAVDKTAQNTVTAVISMESKTMTNCDKNVKSITNDENCDNSNGSGEEKVEEKEVEVEVAATVGHTTVNSSRNSFSFCSTNSTTNNNRISSNCSDSNNELTTATLPTTATLTHSATTALPPQQWKTLRGKFFWITGANITCACARSPQGIARYSHLGDGQLDLILVRKSSILNNLRFAMRTMSRSGDIRNLPFVEVYRTRQMRFRAQSSNEDIDLDYAIAARGSTQPIAEAFTDDVADKLFSSWNCDGEVVHDLEVTMTSHCQLIDVFMRGPYSYTKPMNEDKRLCKFCCCGSDN